jgi:hypothetical protein
MHVTIPNENERLYVIGDIHGRLDLLDRLIANPFPTPYVALKGNHEALLEAFLTDPAVGLRWRTLGGLETLHSYGVPGAD